MSYVTALVTDPALHQRLSRATGGRYRLRIVHDAGQLWAALRELHVALVVLEAHARPGVDLPALVRSLRANHPQLPITLYAHVRPGVSAAILDLVRAGAHHFVLAGVDDDRLLGLTTTAARSSVRDDVLDRAEALHLPADVLKILRQFLDAAERPLAVRDAAATLGVSRRTLLNRLAHEGVPGPRELAAWCRLVVAARLLDDPGLTVEYVANALEFPSGNALRNLLLRRLGVPLAALRQRGGYAYVRDRLLGVLGGGRLSGVAAHVPGHLQRERPTHRG